MIKRFFKWLSTHLVRPRNADLVRLQRDLWRLEKKLNMVYNTLGLPSLLNEDKRELEDDTAKQSAMAAALEPQPTLNAGDETLENPMEVFSRGE